MIKTKMIRDGILACEADLDTKINNFIKENNIKVIDIKFSVDNIPTALIIYEVEE